MNSILLAFNSQPDDSSHNFFQTCADEARQICSTLGIEYTNKTGAELTELEVMRSMTLCSVGLFAVHGSYDAIVNEEYDDLISARTTNYALKGKALYTISCHCASGLLPELRRIGISMFVGYNDEFVFTDNESIYADCALSGFRSFLGGNSLKQAKSDMQASFDTAIRNAETSSNIFEKMILLRDKEALVVEGNPELTFSELR